ncbi:hypothetical protein TSAR_015909 [Trichomalopsis sarcophagae]|uniref:MYND-type domain-containing protein n=1 Tax=Trichomalopsis sarcophagae TaxID=543379 RepID=A0A232EFX9_9HYME|nr:hypothetical protein TSAR_015909 [Trichomalopsis sarcophagae]
MKPSTDEEVCAVCKVPAKQKCGGCKSVFYCGREHQKANWREHSAKCKSYKLVENEKLGRHYVAIRRIEAGEVVIREDYALVQAPQQETVPICLGCYKPLKSDTAKPCELCGWPLCASCTSHGAECDFTKRHRDTKVTITGFGIAHPTYKCISVVRALALRETNPEAYDRFTKLASGELEEPREVARFVKRFFDKLDDFSEDEIARAAGIMQINGHEVPISEPVLIAVYDESSYVEHSCRANCSKSFSSSGGIVIRAAMDIEKGEHIAICYTDPLWGAANRRHHLLRTKFFECTCQRCSDPTEFGSMFNAVKCSKSDCSGCMLPKSFTVEEIPDYQCNKCDNSRSSNSIDEMLEQIGKEMASMRKNDAGACRSFTKKYASKLHDNHYYMTDVKLALAQMIGQQTGGLPALDNETISEKILICKKLDDLLKTIVPAENRVRGLVLFEMHAAVAEFARRQDREQLYDILRESKRLLNEAYQLLKYEPELLPEGIIAKTAKKNLREMDMILKQLCRNTVTPL